MFSLIEWIPDASIIDCVTYELGNPLKRTSVIDVIRNNGIDGKTENPMYGLVGVEEAQWIDADRIKVTAFAENSSNNAITGTWILTYRVKNGLELLDKTPYTH